MFLFEGNCPIDSERETGPTEGIVNLPSDTRE
jgi:hypothetical protein